MAAQFYLPDLPVHRKAYSMKQSSIAQSSQGGIRLLLLLRGLFYYVQLHIGLFSIGHFSTIYIRVCINDHQMPINLSLLCYSYVFRILSLANAATCLSC